MHGKQKKVSCIVLFDLWLNCFGKTTSKKNVPLTIFDRERDSWKFATKGGDWGFMNKVKGVTCTLLNLQFLRVFIYR